MNAALPSGAHAVRAGKQRRRLPIGRLAALVTLLALSCLFVLPFAWLVINALKATSELEAFPITLWPLHPQWDNFRQALTLIDYGKFARNSFELSLISMILTTLTSALVGFGFARLRGRGKNALFILMLSTTMLPGLLLTIPRYVLYARLGMIGTYWPWVVGGLGSSVFLAFLFRQFFAGIPRELEDAAIVDGCGYGRIFWSIFLPLSKPVIATAAIFSFQGTWDDWFGPLIFLNADNTTLSVAMSAGYTDPRGDILTNVLSAGSIFYTLPVIVIFFLAQRYFVQGIVTTGLKG